MFGYYYNESFYGHFLVWALFMKFIYVISPGIFLRIRIWGHEEDLGLDL